MSTPKPKINKEKGSKELFSSANKSDVSGSLSNLSLKSILQEIQNVNLKTKNDSEKIANDGGVDLAGKTKGSLARYSLSAIDNMTEATYNRYGWTKVNGVLSAKEMSVFLKKVGERKNGVKFNRSADGKFIIEVGDEFGVNNVQSTLTATMKALVLIRLLGLIYTMKLPKHLKLLIKA